MSSSLYLTTICGGCAACFARADRAEEAGADGTGEWRAVSSTESTSTIWSFRRVTRSSHVPTKMWRRQANKVDPKTMLPKGCFTIFHTLPPARMIGLKLPGKLIKNMKFHEPQEQDIQLWACTSQHLSGAFCAFYPQNTRYSAISTPQLHTAAQSHCLGHRWPYQLLCDQSWRTVGSKSFQRSKSRWRAWIAVRIGQNARISSKVPTNHLFSCAGIKYHVKCVAKWASKQVQAIKQKFSNQLREVNKNSHLALVTSELHVLEVHKTFQSKHIIFLHKEHHETWIYKMNLYEFPSFCNTQAFPCQPGFCLKVNMGCCFF